MRPALATLALEMRAVEVGVAAFHGFYYTNWPYQMAAAVTGVPPLLLVFLVGQGYFIRGVQVSGFK